MNHIEFDVFYDEICTQKSEQFKYVTETDVKAYMHEVYTEFKRIYNKFPDLLLVQDISNFCTNEMIKHKMIPKFLSFEGYNFKQIRDSKISETDSKTSMISDIQSIYANCQRVQCDKIKCRRCNSVDIFQYSLQTRSADEPTSEYGECLSCKFSWRIA